MLSNPNDSLTSRTNHSLHAIRGDGTIYNKMDKNTDKGMNPFALALMICDAVSTRRSTLVAAPLYMKFAILMQTMFPSVFGVFMNNKAKKAKNIQ